MSDDLAAHFHTSAIAAEPTLGCMYLSAPTPTCGPFVGADAIRNRISPAGSLRTWIPRGRNSKNWMDEWSRRARRGVYVDCVDTSQFALLG